ncbi:MAG TPA: hypothetical protein VGQ03_10655 [Nitrososphaera sp.]|nr:hypothetical protein [Nitrososphaera sp.]
MKRNACRICNKKILVSSSDFTELCIVCGSEFREMMIAVAELSAEIENAYSVKAGARPRKGSLPGVPIEEIAIRMELNRIKKN